MILKLRAFIPKDQTGKQMMFYQNDQYFGSFLRRCNTFASNMEHDSYAIGKYTLMMWTTLYDTHDKEIYEGDYVKTETGEIYEVVWRGAGFCLASIDKTKLPVEQELNVVFAAELIVVGNKFENKF